MPPRTIAIDGPAGSGKSVIGIWLARFLGYAYLDTGALYRAVTRLALDRGLTPADGERIVELLGTTTIDVVAPSAQSDARGYRVLLDDRDATESLFTAEVNAWVSPISADPAVRAALIPVQRRIAEAGSVVMTGRDIGTVVMPNAELKLYLDASVERRAERRWHQEQRLGGTRPLHVVLEDVKARDQLDSSRAIAPLRPAGDAVRVETDFISIDEEKAKILDLIARHDTADSEAARASHQRSP